jgi:uncharacterized repeat protein (TIGR03943 family)
VTRQTQGLILALLGAVLLRLSIGDGYLRYVTEWMRWPILVTGGILLLLAVGPVLSTAKTPVTSGGSEEDDGHGHAGVPTATWLLILPGLVLFVIAPPELGSYLAERRANQSAAVEPAVVAPLAENDTNRLPVQEFVWRAQSRDGSLVARTVMLTGFVSHQDDAWFVTRLTIGCCAADALAFRVRVEGADRPDRDQWVRVTGTYVDGTGSSIDEDPALDAESVVPISQPRQTYE